jgi:hypothetical protein
MLRVPAMRFVEHALVRGHDVGGAAVVDVDGWRG